MDIVGIADVDPNATTLLAVPSGKPFAKGDVLGERYRVEGVLGEGAMGVVYLVEHVHMRKRFALKVLDRARAASTPDAFARFEREAMAASTIADGHIAHATDSGRLDDGSHFLVLEYVDGRTLREVLARGALAPRRALLIARGVASAVEAAHAIGIIHRDLKPENIMLLDRDGDPDYVKVLDFGIAALRGAAAARDSSKPLTEHGVMIGTPGYVSPEQAVGERVDARTDLYSIGVVLFEMVTGKCPFQGSAASVIRQHLTQEPPPLPPSRGGERAAEVVRRLLAKNPEERFRSAEELVAALDECLESRERANVVKTVRIEGPAIVPAPRGERRLPSGLWGRAASVQRAVLLWPRKLAGYVQARRRRARGTFPWARPVLRSFHSWRRRRNVQAALALPLKVANHVRSNVARAAPVILRRRVAVAVAAAVALLLLALVWATRKPEATPAAALSSSPRHGEAPAPSSSPASRPNTRSSRH
jgi:hypothetical protein